MNKEKTEYCKKFKGGLCKYVKMHVPRSWCLTVCKGNWDGKNVNSPDSSTVSIFPNTQQMPTRNIAVKTKNNKLTMAKDFVRAMSRFKNAGFKFVDKQVFIERGICCTTCGYGKQCPYCGCKLKLKTRLKSETACPNSTTYPNLGTYPPRNYWEVVGQTVTVIISARNEPNLNRTIKNLLKNSIGKIEFVIVLDGHKQKVIRDKRIRVIKNKEPLGRRVSINKAAEIANGDYLFVIDAHCTMSEGWDTRLKCACEKQSIAISVISPLNKNWELEPSRYHFVCLSENLQEKWWNGNKPKEPLKTIEETMAFTGCAWMIHKDYYWKLGGYDESLGEYGLDGPEWALKVWLNKECPGRILLRTDVICGHRFGTNENNELYSARIANLAEFKNKMMSLYGTSIYKLVNRFAPVPTWDVNRLPLIVAIRPIDNSASKKIMGFAFESLQKALVNGQTITIEKSPKKPRSHLTLYEQILQGLLNTDSKYVFIVEQDVLYHKSHFDFVPTNDDTFYYQTNHYCLDKDGYFKFGTELLSMLVCNRKLLIENIKTRIEALNKGWNLVWTEPGISDPEGKKYNVGYYRAECPSINIRHKSNFTGGQKSNQHLERIPCWEKAEDLIRRLQLS